MPCVPAVKLLLGQIHKRVLFLRAQSIRIHPKPAQQKFVYVNAQRPRILGVKGVLGIDECSGPSLQKQRIHVIKYKITYQKLVYVDTQ